MNSREKKTPDEDHALLMDAAAAEMYRYGITWVPADIFHYREYRYARLGDALAKAKRDVKGGGALAAPK